jgi:hypothetical protein
VPITGIAPQLAIEAEGVADAVIRGLADEPF